MLFRFHFRTTMKIYLQLLTPLIFWCENSRAQISIFETFLPQYRIGKDLLLNFLQPSSKDSRNLRIARDLHKLQPRLDDSVPFPCPLMKVRSKKRPKSVHKLRPGDIDVIGALGDSLTAGNGLTATTILQAAIENRGMSFTIGGQGTWRQFVTLPNILKEFNSRLRGYSLQDSFGHHEAAQFNAAETGAISSNMPYMSKVLIQRMKDSPLVNITKDWKMISFMIGSNDICSEVCYRKNPEETVEEHRKDLLDVLRRLRDNLPRTIVNLIITPNLKTLTNISLSNRPSMCYFTHNIECPCLFGLQFKRMQSRLEDVMLKWQHVEVEVANQAEFDRKDFTVVLQPFTANYKLHTTEKGLTDYTALSTDCFHLSQKEGARAALSLWNNLMEPVGRKSTQASELFNFKCPTRNQPFIFTKRNSS